MTGQFPELLKVFEHNMVTTNNHFIPTLYLQIFLGFLVLLTIFGSIRIIQQYDTKKVSFPKIFYRVFPSFSFSRSPGYFYNHRFTGNVGDYVHPGCFPGIQFFGFLKSRFWGELIIALLIGIVIFMQIMAL